jgi:hypothetical protein
MSTAKKKLAMARWRREERQTPWDNVKRSPLPDEEGTAMTASL